MCTIFSRVRLLSEQKTWRQLPFHWRKASVLVSVCSWPPSPPPQPPEQANWIEGSSRFFTLPRLRCQQLTVIQAAEASVLLLLFFTKLSETTRKHSLIKYENGWSHFYSSIVCVWKFWCAYCSFCEKVSLDCNLNMIQHVLNICKSAYIQHHTHTRTRARARARVFCQRCELRGGWMWGWQKNDKRRTNKQTKGRGGKIVMRKGRQLQIKTNVETTAVCWIETASKQEYKNCLRRILSRPISASICEWLS